MKLYLLVIKLDNNGVHNNIIENCDRLQLLVHLGTITILEVLKLNFFSMHLCEGLETRCEVKISLHRWAVLEIIYSGYACCFFCTLHRNLIPPS
jgi:hypothetical protein